MRHNVIISKQGNINKLLYEYLAEWDLISTSLFFSVYVIFGHYYEHVDLIAALESKKLLEKG